MAATLTVPLNPAQVLGIAAAGVMLGFWLKRRAPLLERWEVPAPVAGGLALALMTLALRDRVANFVPDLVLRDVLMVAFFTTIGLAASPRLIRRGGRRTLAMLALASAGAVAQNAIGAAAAWALGLHPLIGILAGAVSLTGGPATSLAFGQTFEAMGVKGATTVAVSSATFGIVLSGLVSSALSARLIRRRGLKPREAASGASRARTADALSAGGLLRVALLIALAMGLGTLLTAAFTRAQIVLPGYVGAMIAAGFLRYFIDLAGWEAVDAAALEAAGRVSLYLFLVMALFTLKLWELAALAGPLLAILTLQVALTMALSAWLCFRAMGSDYEAAVMAGGFCGFMLGTTANSLAAMEEVTAANGPAPEAFLVVPIVGGFLLDFSNSLVITASANLIR